MRGTERYLTELHNGGTMKVAVLANGDIHRLHGLLIRAKSIFELIRGKYETKLVIYGNATEADIVSLCPRPTRLRYFKLMITMLRNNFDCVYINDCWYFFICYPLSRLRRFKILYDAMALDPVPQVSNVRYKIWRFLQSYAVKKADCVITLSEEALRFYSKYNNNITYIPLFIDESLFPERIVRHVQGREAAFKRLGYVGPFVQWIPESSLEFLYHNLDKFDKRIQFVIIGKCDSKIKDERIVYTGHLGSMTEYINVLCSLDGLLNCIEVSFVKVFSCYQ